MKPQGFGVKIKNIKTCLSCHHPRLPGFIISKDLSASFLSRWVVFHHPSENKNMRKSYACPSVELDRLPNFLRENSKKALQPPPH